MTDTAQTETLTAPQAAMPDPEAPPSAVPAAGDRGVTMLLFCAAVFLSAFLLFQVQPLIGKFILPWFGASPGVWTTCMLFFQVVLLGGYAYAHLIVSRLSGRRQAITHVCVLGLALLTLPITPATAWKPGPDDEPIGRILLVLAASVGVPFALLSSTGPLLQGWFARLHPGRSPYRLFALSNAGSLLALISYPLVVERALRLREQTAVWSVLFGVFALLCGACAWKLLRGPVAADRPAARAQPAADAGPSARPRIADVALWIVLSACGSALLLASTNQICLDVAVVPFLWVLPLALYLLTFILCFESERWYSRPLFCALLAIALVDAVRVLAAGPDIGIVEQIATHATVMFVCCMCCHGELARLKPRPEYLTLYFLMVSLGGAVGGLFVAIVAPRVFTGVYEYPALLVACYALVLAIGFRRVLADGARRTADLRARNAANVCWTACATAILCGIVMFFVSLFDLTLTAAFGVWLGVSACLGATAFVLMFRFLDADRRRFPAVGFAAIASLGLTSLTAALGSQVLADPRVHIAADRNFYGVLSIEEFAAGKPDNHWAMRHGRISHGFQYRRFPTWPTSSYGVISGAGLAIRLHPKRGRAGRQFRVGVVGLGAGTLAAYANARLDEQRTAPASRVPADYVRFYEINPLVRDWATEHFRYLSDARARGADVDVWIGDARIVMERQLERGDAQRFDVLVVDAFAGDAIPIHLLTAECFAVYERHLADGGIIAVHVTNRYLDLVPVVRRLGEELGKECVFLKNDWDLLRGVDANHWVLLTNNRAFLSHPDVTEGAEEMPPPGPLWTDDFSSLFEVLK